MTTTKLYKYQELSPEAKMETVKNWLSEYNYPPLMEKMDVKLAEILRKNKIKIKGEMPNFYSLEGRIMFTGSFEWRSYYVNIKKGSSDEENFVIRNIRTSQDADDRVYYEFEWIYANICEVLEKYRQSEMKEILKEGNIERVLEEFSFSESGRIVL